VQCKVGARFAPYVRQAQKSFWTHPMPLLGYEAQVQAHFSPFVLTLTPDRCSVCDERTIGSEIVFDAPDGTAR
jgi:hypothetical protein